MPKDPRSELSRISQVIGERTPFWVQGAGGNVSFKEKDRLWIKATGTRLDGVTPTHGIAELDRSSLVRELEKLLLTGPGESAEVRYSEVVGASARTETRPSMESGFHALLPKKWVLHFHSLTAIVMADMARGNPAIGSWMKRAMLCRIPFANPGLELTRELQTAPSRGIYVLENHGVVLQSETEPDAWDGALKEWIDVEREFCRTFGVSPALYGGAPSEGMPVLDTLNAPWRSYFPDAAVFRQRISAHLRVSGSFEGEPTFCWDGGPSDDRDAREIWQALVLLYSSHPQLRALSAQKADGITTLPTEKVRIEKLA